MKLLSRRALIYHCKRLNSVKHVEASTSKELKPVIGLEIHAQLLTRSKMFSNAPIVNHAPSNTNVSLFDLATPGTLPTLNKRCVELAIRAALLFNCEIAKECRFDRKHYFYPDMPNGFQITQQELPIARKGYVDFFMKKTGELDAEFTESDRRRVRIKQLQMEMDSGKIVHTADNNLVDLNRAGIGLIEIVTEPELSSPTEAAYFVEHLRLMLLHNQICQGEMHSGQLRIDANVSISVDGKMGVRTETKNISSFREIQQCLEFEIKRQTDLINRDEKVKPETRAAANGKTVLLRVKSGEMDYRFLPEPNLPRLQIKNEMVEQQKKELKLDAPHLVYIFKHKLPVGFTFEVVSDDKLKAFVDKCFDIFNSDTKKAVGLIQELAQIFRSCRAIYPPEEEHIVNACRDLMDLSLKRKITHLAYLDLIRLYATGKEESIKAAEKITELDLWAINDEAEILRIVDETFADAQPIVIENARNKPQSKHFNKLRNLVVNRVNKRIHIEDAEKYVLQRLNE